MTEQTEATEKAPAKKEDKPQKQRHLTVTEKRDLAKLIDNDFEALRGEMQVFANELKRNRLTEIEGQVRGREEEARAALAEWRAVRAQCYELVDQFRRRWQDQGFRVGAESNRYGDRNQMISMVDNVAVTVPEKDEALNNVANDVDHQYHKARTELERQRLQLQRDLLLTGLVSEEAQRLMAKMPDPRVMLLGAIRAANNPRLAAIEAVAAQQVGGEVAEPPVQQEEQRVHIPEVLDQ